MRPGAPVGSSVAAGRGERAAGPAARRVARVGLAAGADCPALAWGPADTDPVPVSSAEATAVVPAAPANANAEAKTATPNRLPLDESAISTPLEPEINLRMKTTPYGRETKTFRSPKIAR